MFLKIMWNYPFGKKRYFKKTLLIMKLTAVLLFAACLQVSATGYSQKITLSQNNVSLRKVFKEIEKQSDYQFFYKDRLVSQTENVSIHVTNASIGEALDQCLKDQPLSYTILDKIIVVKAKPNVTVTIQALAVHPSFPLNIITGTVKDQLGNPLGGVSVIIKGTNKGTSTKVDGSFSIDANARDVLEFTFVGYQKKSITINKTDNLSIVMEIEATVATEVVVVGYTSKPLAQLSSSISVVSGEQLNDVTSNDVTSLLQGKAAGLIVSNSSSGDPGSAPTVIIRGSSSISAGSAPLYVVDGIIGGNVNPNDVESVTILKDAAATGLYGSRAANGVIIITSKSGKSGKTNVRLSSTVGFNNASFGKFNVMNSQQLYDYEKTFFPPNVMASTRPDSLLSVNTNWRNLAFRTGITQDYAVAVSGGSEKTKVYISGDYYNEEGTIKTIGSGQYSFRANVSHEISSKLKLNVNISGNYRKFTQDASGHYGVLEGANNNMPFDNPFNPDGSIKMGTEPGWIGREHDNFLQGFQYNFNNTKLSGITGDLDLTYKIVPDLTFSTFNRVGYNNAKHVLYLDARSKYGGGTKGELDNGFSNNSGLITSNRLQYKNNFGKNNLSVLGVVEAEKNYSDNDSIVAQGLPAGLAVMNVASTILSGKGSTSENSFNRGLAQLDYNYDNRYFAVASFINESSSRFGANKRSANFYTLAGSWIVSNEHFMENQNFFDLLKVRVSYGSTGNAQINDYQSLGLYSYTSQYAGFSGSVQSQLANNNLTWEKAKTTNFGLDIGIFKRISMSIDLYNKTTAALLLNVPLPYTSGYSSVIENVGSVRNKGLEINLNTDNLTGNFKWTTNFNIAFNRNRVLKLNQGKDIVSGNQNVSVGHDLFSWYMRKWAGVDPNNGDPLWEKVTTDANNNKVVTTTNSYNAATLQFVGTGSPDFTGGMSNEFSYKRFSLNVFLNFVSGNLVYNSQREGINSDGAYQDYNNAILPAGHSNWMKPGDKATEPLQVYGGNKLSNKPSSRYLENGSYIRLRNINLAYELPTSILNRTKITSFKIFVSGDNLWTGTDYSGMDPEVSLLPGAGTLSRTNFPISKKVLFGINVGF